MPDRVIRDELLDSDRWLGLCSDTERLAFMGLVLRCDDFGNLEGGAQRLFRLLSSFTQIKSAENVATVLMHLSDQDLIRHYDVDGRQLIHIPRLRPHRQYLVRKCPPSPWCDESAPLGKAKRIVNKGLAKSAATTSPQRSNDVAQGVGVGVGENPRGARSVDNSPSAPTTQSGASTLKVKGNGKTRATPPPGWWKSDADIATTAAAYGVTARPGEGFADLKRRTFDAIAAAERG